MQINDWPWFGRSRQKWLSAWSVWTWMVFKRCLFMIKLVYTSKLWHVLISVSIPDEVINGIQNKSINFPWQWKTLDLNTNIYLPVNKSPRIVSYRFQSRDSRNRFVNIFLNKMNDEEYCHCFYFFVTFLTILNYDVKIFPLDEDHQHHNISTFYQEKQQLENVFNSL